MLDTAVSVSAVQQNESAIYVHISLLFSFPSRLGHLRALVEFPVLYRRFSLVICYIHSSVYMSIPLSRFISLPPFPAWSMFVLYVCVCFCYADKIIYTIFLHLLLILTCPHLLFLPMIKLLFFWSSFHFFETVLPLLCPYPFCYTHIAPVPLDDHSLLTRSPQSSPGTEAD